MACCSECAKAEAQEQAQLQSLQGSKCIVNSSILANFFLYNSLYDTIATYSADLMDSLVNVTQQRAVHKILSKNFPRKIKATSMNFFLMCRSYAEIHVILERTLRNWFSDHIVQLSRTKSTP
jgi:hypothetical protein